VADEEEDHPKIAGQEEAFAGKPILMEHYHQIIPSHSKKQSPRGSRSPRSPPALAGQAERKKELPKQTPTGGKLAGSQSGKSLKSNKTLRKDASKASAVTSMYGRRGGPRSNYGGS